MNQLRLVVGLLVAVCLSFCMEGQEKGTRAPLVEHPLLRFTHFSATMTGGALHDQPRKVYRSGNLFRIDLDREVHITDLVGHSTWVVRPDRCTHLTGVDLRSFPFFGYLDHVVERQPASEHETVDEHLCSVETFTFTPKEGPKVVTTMRLWQAQDLRGFPIRIEVARSAKTMTFTYTDVRVEAPDPKLLELPARCPDFEQDRLKTLKPPARKRVPPKGTPNLKP